MRADTPAFAAKNLALAKDPRYVIEISFDSANTVLRYFTSHADAALPAGAVSFATTVQGLSGTSQTLNTDVANASIGNINFRLVDRAGAITLALGGQLQLGRSTRLQRVRVYVGYQDLAWADYTLVQTQLVQDISFSRGAYVFRCVDIQREMRKDIFDIAKTSLTASLLRGDKTVNVISTSLFSTVAHGTSYSDAPSATVGYIRIEDEIMRWTSKAATTFTLDLRGALNTLEVDHLVDPAAAVDRQTPVEEYVYLEMPALKLAYALLTGVLYNQGGATLPTAWHLGIPTGYVRLADFIDPAKIDLWDPADDTAGFVTLFQDLKKTDGKKFIETEIDLLCGTFGPIYASGERGCKRLANILTGAAYVAQLDESNVVDYGDLLHDYPSVRNILTIAWNWDPLQEAFTRPSDALIDLGSIGIYKKAAPLNLSFRGLHGSRHSSAMLSGRFDALRDRYSGAPFRIDVAALSRLNPLEVGDVVRLRLPNVRDSVASSVVVTALDRSFEIQNISVDWITGALKLKLMATSRAPDAIAATSDASVLTSAFRTGAGTAITSVLTTSGTGPKHVTANGTLTGNADMTAAGAIYYVDDDLQIDTGVTIKITGNVQIRCKSFRNNGVIDGVGAGLTGASAPASPASSAVNPGTVGAIGVTEAGGGIILTGRTFSGFLLQPSYIQGMSIAGRSATVPVMNLIWDGVTLDGIPTDLRGTSGSSGTPSAISQPSASFWTGGAGGNGGAGLCIVCTGFSQGVSGKIDLSGSDGVIGSSVPELSFGNQIYAGSGAGGASGGLLVLLDGIAATATDLTETGFVAKNGKTPIPGNSGTYEDVIHHLVANTRSSYVGTGDGTLFPVPSMSGVRGSRGVDYISMDRRKFLLGGSALALASCGDCEGMRGGCRVQYIPGNQAAVPDIPTSGDVVADHELLASNWTKRSNPKNITLEAIVYSGTKYVAVGGLDGATDAYIVDSPDGITWTERANPKNFTLNGVAWNGSVFVACGDADGTDAYLISSADAITWTERTNAKNKNLLGICWNGSIFVAVGDSDGTQPYIITSSDGTTWTQRSVASPKTIGLNGVTWNGSIFVAVGDADGSDAYLLTSPDGVNWTERANPQNKRLNSVVWADQLKIFVAVGASTLTYIVTSPDGVAWTAASTVVTSDDFRGVTWSGAIFVAVGGSSNQNLISSRDGSVWTVRETLQFTPLTAVVWSGKRFVAVGAGDGTASYIITSLAMSS